MASHRTSWGWAAKIVLAVLTVAYPMAVYWALSSGRPRFAGVVLGVFALVLLLSRAGQAKRGQLLSVLPAPLVVLLVVVVSSWLAEPRLLLLLPALINAVFLVTFGSTLRPGAVPMVERFARLIDGDLSSAQQAYCRTVTWVWCAFFVANGGTALALALWASVRLWTLYTGLIAYVLMGLLFAAEYSVRSFLFRAQGRGLLAKRLGAIFPPRP